MTQIITSDVSVPSVEIEGEDEHLTEEQVALYDRQIRIWGVKAQQRLMNTRVLICYINHCHTELAKNLAVAGVSFDVADPRNDGSDCESFLVNDQESGQDVSTCFSNKLQEMSSSVTIKSVPWPFLEDGTIKEDVIDNYEYFILPLDIPMYLKTWVCLETKSSNETRFLYTLSCGPDFSFCVSNFRIVEEQESDKPSEPSTVPTNKLTRIKYSSLKEILNSSCDLSTLKKQKDIPKFIFLALISELQGIHAVDSRASSDVIQNSFEVQLASCKKHIGQSSPLPSFIIGSLATQELLKCFMRTEMPFAANLFSVNTSNSQASVFNIGCDLIYRTIPVAQTKQGEPLRPSGISEPSDWSDVM